jgi:serine/threonine protein kinase/Tol biopolymer transport system component
MALAAGSRLNSYEILAPLGAGGMGEVYRAHDSSLKRDVAIKVLPAYCLRDPDRLRRFELEAQATAALNHPNIVSIFHIGQYDGSPYIVTELLQGESLRERLNHGPMRIREALDITGQIAQGLAAAHSAGVVHRDLKPENIFITKDGRTKILDFGLAKLEQTKAVSADSEALTLQSAPGYVLGTVGYMSPEQVRGERAGPRSDSFATGVILYEMLTGQRAFRKATSAETMTAILNEDPPLISQFAPSVPAGLQKVVNRCLAKDPEQRFQHAADLAFALEALSDSTGVPAAATTAGTVDSKRWITIAVSLLVVALAVTIGIWWILPSPVPTVGRIAQLTDDGEPKQGPLLTDGSRIYFLEGSTGNYRIMQVAVTGGATAIVPTRLSNAVPLDLSSTGSEMLVAALTMGDFKAPLWLVPLPAGEPRRLNGLEAQDAALLPDGRILLARAREIYLADKDGSNAQKLVGVDGEPWTVRPSPDGKQFVTSVYRRNDAKQGLEVGDTNGSPLRALVQPDSDRSCCALWTRDGRYIVFVKISEKGRSADLWALRMKSGLFSGAHDAVQLTSGPLQYINPSLSRDGSHVFAIGLKPRSEVVRYDPKTRQFIPFLSGMSAVDVTFSRDGNWVAYAAYPDHTLWRSRADGSERLQLTYVPMRVSYPFISPDGSWVVFSDGDSHLYRVKSDGGTPEKIADKTDSATWNPSGTLLALSSVMEKSKPSEDNVYLTQLLDFQSGKLIPVPSGEGMVGAQWLNQDQFVAARQDSKKLSIFDMKTQKWSDLTSESAATWATTLDWKYLYYTTADNDPKLRRIHIADSKVETIADLKDLRQVLDWVDGTSPLGVAPDGSAIFAREIGSQEIYALNLKWP